jgi:hypothetical protein
MNIQNLWCGLGGEKFATGAHACDGKNCYVCEDGHWVDTFIDSSYRYGPLSIWADVKRY